MIEQSIASLTMAYREEHTSSALLRSANIENCAPDGYFKLIHSCALATKDGNPKTIGEIRKVAADSKKPIKDVMENLGRITAQPFPIIDSSKRSGLQSTTMIESPLYDISTGNTVAERYASVNMSKLGKLLTRHYLDKGMNEVEYYNSIVPYSLLRRSMPFAMGYREEMYPLNPKELFIIMREMIKANSPIIDSSILEENFKGFDLGEGYNIYMTPESLLELYTNGVSSFVAVPEVTIDRKNKELIFEMPPLDSTSRKLRNHFIEVHGDVVQGYKTFSYDIDVKLVGKRVLLQIESFNGTDEDILKELLNSSFITTKKSISNTTIRYHKNKKITRPEDSILGKVIMPKVLTDYEPFKSMTDEQLRKLMPQQIRNMVSKNKDLPDLLSNKTAYEDIVLGLTNRNEDPMSEYGGKNPYTYEIDKAPVVEVLWECIEGERALQLEKVKKKLEALKEKLKYDLLYEKASRPAVAEVIYKYQRERQAIRINLLLKAFPKGNKTLPEGFEKWEVEEIYKYTGNNFLARIFERERFENEFKYTQQAIAELEEKINNVSKLDEDILEDLNMIINDSRYGRKSNVYFLKDESMTKLTQITPTHFWDDKNLPVSLYYDEKMMVRSYGINLYVNQFQPKMELRTRNDKMIGILYTATDGTIQMRMVKVREIPRNGYLPLPPGLRGIIPLYEDTDITIFTNKAKYYKYKNIPKITFNFADDEYVVGFIAEPYRYIDILCSDGIQTIDMLNVAYYKTKFNKLGNNIRDLYDVRLRDELNNDIVIPVPWGSYYVSKYKLLKTFEGSPVQIRLDNTNKVFSDHLALFVDDIYVPEWKYINFDIKEDKYRPNRPIVISEYGIAGNKKDIISEDLINKLDVIGNDIRLGKNENYKLKLIITNATPSYFDININDSDFYNIVDQRILESRGN